MPPSILGSEALVIWMLSTARKAPISAPPTAIQVRSSSGRSAAAPPAVLLAIVASRLRRGMCRFCIDRRLDGHPGAQTAGERVALVDGDLDGNALNDFGEISGRVIGRQQRKLLATGRRQAVHVTTHSDAVKRI